VRTAAAVICALLAALGASAGAAADDPPPETTIVSGPPRSTTDPTPTFVFSASEAGTFQCSMDGGPFGACASPYEPPPVAVGSHTLAVRAVDGAGQPDPTPATWEWTASAPLDPPTIELTAPAARKVRRGALRRFAGTAAAPSGVTRVELALMTSDPPTREPVERCRFVRLRSGKRTLDFCSGPPWVRAQRDGDDWSYALPARVRRAIEPGRYRVVVRALNGYGAATRKEFPLRVLRPPARRHAGSSTTTGIRRSPARSW